MKRIASFMLAVTALASCGAAFAQEEAPAVQAAPVQIAESAETPAAPAGIPADMGDETAAEVPAESEETPADPGEGPAEDVESPDESPAGPDDEMAEDEEDLDEYWDEDTFNYDINHDPNGVKCNRDPCETYDSEAACEESSGDTACESSAAPVTSPVTSAAPAQQSEEDHANVIASGICGEHLTWILDADGVLTISGTGDMYEYFDDEAEYSNFDEFLSLIHTPWSDYSDMIRGVVIESGVASVCRYAFFQCGRLTEVSISDSVTSIGGAAFDGCGLRDLMFGGTMQQWNDIHSGYNLYTVHCADGDIMEDAVCVCFG